MKTIDTVTVVGANGTMGCNVAAIFASFGNAKVYMVSRDLEKSKQAVLKAAKSVRADSITRKLIPADYDMLSDCVSESDLVFESVAENMEIKLQVMRKIMDAAREDVILATGTSGLSITTLAETCPEKLRSRFFGVHMFNPPYNLTLCELIPTCYSDKNLQAELKIYLTETLHRTVVEVKDMAAFLGNRVGFQFINRALQYAEKYKYSGGVDYIDAILGAYSGRSMAPIVTADFVGLDVHKAIVDNVCENAPDYARATFEFPEYCAKLVAEGRLGRKTSGGLYKQEVRDNGAKRRLVYDIASDSYREQVAYSFPFAMQMKAAIRTGNYEEAFRTLVENRSAEAEICLEFLLEYIVYALFAVREVGFTVHAADDVMATGFNWCPPLAVAEAIGSVSDLGALIRDRLDDSILNGIDVDGLLSSIEPSRYDYRLYFKSL